MASISETEVVSALDVCATSLFCDPQFAVHVSSMSWDSISLVMSVVVADYLNTKYFPKDTDGVGRAKVALVDMILLTPYTKYVVAVPQSSYAQSKNFEHLIINVARYVYLKHTATVKNDFISHGPLFVTIAADTDNQAETKGTDSDDVALFRLHRLGHHRTFWAIVPTWIRYKNRRLMRSLKPFADTVEHRL